MKVISGNWVVPVQTSTEAGRIALMVTGEGLEEKRVELASEYDPLSTPSRFPCHAEPWAGFPSFSWDS